MLAAMAEGWGQRPSVLIAGERTGERGDERIGEICLENRGLVRVELMARGPRTHTGTRSAPVDLSARILEAQQELTSRLRDTLTLDRPDGWVSQIRFPYIEVGRPGRYNVSSETGRLGLEVRLIPEDSLGQVLSVIRDYARTAGLETQLVASEAGVACDPGHPVVRHLLDSIRETSGEEPRLGRKLPGTSARFAPGGQGIVWGQSGVGPHAPDERHYLPSIEPYYNALRALGDRLKSTGP
jgi:acetylornithine deacetylase/succinyl-diaminopimelate desuccinylase-like protein